MPKRGRHAPRWGRQLAPPRRNFNFRVTQFRRQDLKKKETGAERRMRRAGIPVNHYVPENAIPFFVGLPPDFDML